MTHRLVSIVLPVYNQADHIEEITMEYQAALAGMPDPCEMILVVNGCHDDSLAVCSALAQKNDTIRVVHCEACGWGFAVRRGLQAARGELLCYTNSARTSAQDLLSLLLYATANPNVVIKANRKIRDNWLRRLGSLLYNLECRALFDLSYWDVNGTPKVFPRAFERLLELTRDDDLIDAEFSIICRREKYPVLEVPIFSTKRHGGQSTTHFRSALRMYWGAFQLWREMSRSGE